MFSGTITGIQNRDNITANYATTATVTSPVGTYPITPSLVDPERQAGQLHRLQHQRHADRHRSGAECSGKQRFPGLRRHQPVFSSTIIGVQNKDDITANYATTATVTSPVASYPITPTW